MTNFESGVYAKEFLERRVGNKRVCIVGVTDSDRYFSEQFSTGISLLKINYIHLASACDITRYVQRQKTLCNSTVVYKW